MADDRTLKAVFDGLAGRSDADPQELHAVLGAHGDLPGELLTAALGSYAETAPAEVAEHLAPFLAGGGDPAAGLGLLSGAPVPDVGAEVPLADDVPDDLPGVPDDPGFSNGMHSFDRLDSADLLDGHDGPGAGTDGLDDGLDGNLGDRFGDPTDDLAPTVGADPSGAEADATDPAFDVASFEDTATGLDESTDDSHDPYLQPADDLDDLFGSDPDDADGLDG